MRLCDGLGELCGLGGPIDRSGPKTICSLGASESASESKNPPRVGWAFVFSTPDLLRGTFDSTASEAARVNIAMLGETFVALRVLCVSNARATDL